MTQPSKASLHALVEQLRPLHERLETPRPGDWLYEQRERGQTFAEYLECQPVRVTRRRRVIDVQPIGRMKPTQRRLVVDTADIIAAFFALDVRVLEPLDLDLIPKRHRRLHPEWGDLQLRSGFILDRVLLPRLAQDAAALIGFTAVDLWPGAGFNFVFGEASLGERVGVWSTFRNGDPAKGQQRYRRVLRRTAQTAVHEVAHMFTVDHCTKYECVMAAANSLPEGDRRPLYTCCECVAKICWATGAAPLTRYTCLASTCDRLGLERDAAFLRRSVRALDRPAHPGS